MLGTAATLNYPDVVHKEIDRLELNTVTCGSVQLDIQVLLVDFLYRGVEMSSKDNRRRELRRIGRRGVEEEFTEVQTSDVGHWHTITG